MAHNGSMQHELYKGKTSTGNYMLTKQECRFECAVAQSKLHNDIPAIPPVSEETLERLYAEAKESRIQWDQRHEGPLGARK